MCRCRWNGQRPIEAWNLLTRTGCRTESYRSEHGRSAHFPICFPLVSSPATAESSGVHPLSVPSPSLIRPVSNLFVQDEPHQDNRSPRNHRGCNGLDCGSWKIQPAGPANQCLQRRLLHEVYRADQGDPCTNNQRHRRDSIGHTCTNNSLGRFNVSRLRQPQQQSY